MTRQSATVDGTVNSAPTGGAVSAQRAIVISLAVNAVVPVAVYYGLRAAGVDQWMALMLGLVAPAAAVVHSIVTTRRIDMLAGLVMTVLLLGGGLSFLTGSPRTLLARDGWVTALAGIWILLTLLRTPYYLSALRLFTGGSVREQIDAAWRATPDFRRVVHVCTIIWGVALLVDAVTTVVLAHTMPIDSVPLIGALKLVAVIVLAEVGSQVYFRRRGAPQPLGGFPGRPEWIGHLIGWLAGPANRFVTGQVIFADGGAEAAALGDRQWSGRTASVPSEP